MAASAKNIFMGVAALGLITAATLPPATPAFAQSAQVEQVSSVTPSRQARRDAIAQSQGRIVIFYGSGVRSAEAAAMSLSRTGYPATAIAGGPNGEAEVFVNRGILGTYSDSSILNGDLGSDAMDAYAQRVGRPNTGLALNR